MIKLCVFDLDGTVMDTLESIAYFVNYTMHKMHLPTIATEKFKYFAGDGRAALLHRSLAFNNADTPENFSLACKIYDRAYENDFMHLTKAFDGIESQLINLKQSGKKIAVLSNKPHNVTGYVIEKTFGKNFFDHVQGQSETVPMKPDPAGFLALADKFGVTPDECVMVGDTNVDMLTGVNAGAHTLGVLWGFREREELLENGAELIIDSTEELSEAVVKITSHKL